MLPNHRAGNANGSSVLPPTHLARAAAAGGGGHAGVGRGAAGKSIKVEDVSLPIPPQGEERRACGFACPGRRPQPPAHLRLALGGGGKAAGKGRALQPPPL